MPPARRIPLCFGAAALLALALACGGGRDADATRETLVATDRAWARTAADPDRFAAFFADAGTFLLPEGTVVKNREAVRRAMAILAKTPGFSLTWLVSTAEVAASGDLGYTHGTYTLTGPDPAGLARRTTGPYLSVWRKQPDGQWKVVASLFSPSPSTTAQTSSASSWPSRPLPR